MSIVQTTGHNQYLLYEIIWIQIFLNHKILLNLITFITQNILERLF